MKKPFLLALSLLALITVSAQQKNKTAAAYASGKKYPSLLWEITGNGLKKPSYLFGTMHVSNKLVFHLGDSFYNAIKNVQVVALETNPETWQEEYSLSLQTKQFGSDMFENQIFNENLSIESFAIKDYTDVLKASLALEPSMINSFLYRTYGAEADDFEEDTYLDMHIFQVGKKLKKKIAGVENFMESEKLVMEAYRDMQKDKEKKQRSYDQDINSPKLMEDAYRKGDLDLLDSLQLLNVTSDAFQEKFLYKRNEIQARSIDTILKKHSLFVAVGAAHLAGKRGVIEMLRDMGYHLRPVHMDQRNSLQKETIEKIHYPVKFTNQTSPDGFYQVSIPGQKFYNFATWNALNAMQYADMVNGAYYTVSRLKTNALFLGQREDEVNRKIDSLLYENIPGKMLKKKEIVKNGFKGWDITSRTRRGDQQRYNIIVTPFEILIFKMSGNGDFVTNTPDADLFFNSVKLKEYQTSQLSVFQPATGGFNVLFPHTPAMLHSKGKNSERIEYAATDKEGNDYLVMQGSFNAYGWLEEDSFELNLMEESFAWSDFIKEQKRRAFSKLKSYSALDVQYDHTDGSMSTVKYILRGPLYYVVAAHHNKENESVKKFMESFTIQPLIYPESKLRVDTSLRYTVHSPVFTDSIKNKELAELMKVYMDEEDEENYSFRNRYKISSVANDTLGERIVISYFAPSTYTYFKDSLAFWRNPVNDGDQEDSNFIYTFDKKWMLENGTRVRETHLTDTGSSKTLYIKGFNKDGHLYTLVSLIDALSPPSSFISNFYNSFRPADSLKGENVYARKTEKFFIDFFSKDTVVAKKAGKSIYDMRFDSVDLPALRAAAERIDWSNKNYLDTKKYFISEISRWNDPKSVSFLKAMYVNVKDTAELQNTILMALLRLKTKESFKAFKDLILEEPPIAETGYGYARVDYGDDSDSEWSDNPWSPLYDTLSLTKSIFPDILQLVNIDDYKSLVMELLTEMVAEGHLKASDYESYFPKFYLEGKRMLKKQIASEEKQKMEKLNRDDEITTTNTYDGSYEYLGGNSELEKYSKLLMPFYDKHAGVAEFFKLLMKTTNQSLLYNSLIMMMKNKKPVADSLFLHFAKTDRWRSQLYSDLASMNRLNQFPAKYKTPQEIGRSMVLRFYGEKPDSVVYLDRLPVNYRGDTGYVYFYKYRKQKDDNFWHIAMAGLLPDKADSAIAYDYKYTLTTQRKLDNDKPLMKQLQTLLHEQMVMRRDAGREFYMPRDNKKDYGDYSGYNR